VTEAWLVFSNRRLLGYRIWFSTYWWIYAQNDTHFGTLHSITLCSNNTH